MSQPPDTIQRKRFRRMPRPQLPGQILTRIARVRMPFSRFAFPAIRKFSPSQAFRARCRQRGKELASRVWYHSKPLLKQILPLIQPRHVGLVLLRFWYEYRQLWKTQIFRDLLDRLIFLFAFGLGMGHLLAASHGGNYLAFIVPGMAASTGLQVMTMGMTYGAYERMISLRLWPAWLATPLRLPDIILAELIYAVLRSLPSTLALLVVAWFLGALPSPLGALLSLPFLLLANLALGAVALCFTSHVHRTIHFAYTNTLWVTPLFLFSGVFFDIHQAPATYQLISEFSPLRHVIDIVRPLMLGTEVDYLSAALDTLLLLVLFLAAYRYALYRFSQRLLD